MARPENRGGPFLCSLLVYVLPARYEPFGLSVLEAALSGCALVLGDIPSLRETWRGAALFVEPEDTDHLRSTLLRLIQNPALVQEQAVYAQCRAIQFTPQQMAAHYLSAYAEAARHGAGRFAKAGKGAPAAKPCLRYTPQPGKPG